MKRVLQRLSSTERVLQTETKLDGMHFEYMHSTVWPVSRSIAVREHCRRVDL